MPERKITVAIGGGHELDRAARAALLSSLPGLHVDSAPEVELLPTQARWVPVSVRLPASSAKGAGQGARAIQFRVERLASGDEPAVAVTEKSTFVVPR